MKREKLADALIGMFAYDGGAVDSGIKDELLKENVKTYLRSLGDKEFRVLLGRIARDEFLSENRLKQGYGLEDVQAFLRWMDDEMGLPI